jgi:predicted TIM-barrel fold metal-dependent hydrolase
VLLFRPVVAALVLTGMACASSGSAPVVSAVPAPPTPAVPRVDHHKHLVGPEAAEWQSEKPLPAVTLPEPLARTLRLRAANWNDPDRLREVFADSVTVLNVDEPLWILEGEEAAEYLSGLFARAHRVTPVAFRLDGSIAFVAGYFSRDVEDGIRHFGHVLLVLRQDQGEWRIVAEMPSFPGPTVLQPVTSEQVVAELDTAGTDRAVVFSVAYWFGSAFATPVVDEHARVIRENDWTAAEAARSSGRLIAFCSFNPLRAYALEELERCAAHPHNAGLKLHLGNSGVDLGDPEHVRRLREIFAAANAARLPVAIHLWTGRNYEEHAAAHATTFLEDVVSAAPDVVIHVAHFAGGGPGYTDAAFGVFAHAIATGDSRARNLYFDIATVADRQPPEVLERLAARIRQVGVERVLWGSDLAPPNLRATEAWANFRTTVPLTDAEFGAIAANVAPYLR